MARAIMHFIVFYGLLSGSDYCVMQAKERWFVLIANRFIYVPDTQPLPIPLHRQWHLTLFIMRFIYLQAYYGQ